MASIELKNYATEQGIKTALVRISGPKWIHILTMDGPLRVRRVPANETDHMSELTFKGRPYPLKRALLVFRHYGNKHGVHTTAKMFLREATRQEKTNDEQIL